MANGKIFSDGDALDALTFEYAWNGEKNIFGGDGSDGAFNPSSSTTISGVKKYSSVNISSGITITVNSWCIMKCTGNINIAGTINCNNGTGIGVLGSGPSAASDSAYSAHYTSGGGGLARGRINYDILSKGYCGDKYIGLRNIIFRRGWFNGYGLSSSGSFVGGGALLIECLGNVTVTGTIRANGQSGFINGGGGMIGILCAGSFNGSGSTFEAKGVPPSIGSGYSYLDSGGGCVVIISESSVTSPATINVNGGDNDPSSDIAGLYYIKANAPKDFVRKPWALGGDIP
jgi:hypothetical protein